MLAQGADVFIVGGGPAGLAAGLAAALRGLSVTVADSAHPPIDKACGEGIMPDGLAALRTFGIDLTAHVGAAFHGIRFVDAAGEVSARFPQGPGFGIRRTVLHTLLAERAASAGVKLLWGSRVEAIRQGEVTIGEKIIRCGYIVCADGQNSSLRQMAGLGVGRLYRRRFGFRSYYRVRPWSPFVEVHWADCGQVYVTPIGEEDICVVLITNNQHLRLPDALPSFPAVQRHLTGLTPLGSSKGAVSATRKLQAVARGRIALLGDASGSADAITGDGLSLAFRQATALAEAICCDDLGKYQRAHAQINSFPRRMGELILKMDDSPRLRRKVFRAFAAEPEMFEKLLTMHTRTISPLQLGVSRCLRFGWSILRA